MNITFYRVYFLNTQILVILFGQGRIIPQKLRQSGADQKILIRGAARIVPLPTGGGAWRGGSAPSRRKIFGFCISNGDFWCILGAIFYSLNARFTHKKQPFGLEIGGQMHKLGVLSSRTTETANDTRNALMENMLCLFSTIQCNEICMSCLT